jgi:hypothetical protein
MSGNWMLRQEPTDEDASRPRVERRGKHQMDGEQTGGDLPFRARDWRSFLIGVREF